MALVYMILFPNMKKYIGITSQSLEQSNDRKFGYNLTSGGDGINGKKFTPEQLKKLSDSHKGIKQSQETIQKRMLKIKGKVRKNSKSVVGVSILTGETVKYKSLAEIKWEGKFHYGHISKCCNGIRKSHAGYAWKYEG